jgi:hypothetical protein
MPRDPHRKAQSNKAQLLPMFERGEFLSPCGPGCKIRIKRMPVELADEAIVPATQNTTATGGV